MQSHHFEIRSADDAGLDFARLAQTDHGEADGGEVAELADGFDAARAVLRFPERKSWRSRRRCPGALPDVDEAVFIAIDERAQQHAAHQAENRGVGADAQRQREDDGDGETFLRKRERAANLRSARKSSGFI